jgi:L-malate glycosyltransferase
MHILLFAPGISVHSQRILQMLLDAGHTVTLVDLHDPKPDGAERYEFIPYPGMFGLERLGLRTVNRLGHLIKAARLRSILRRIKPDVVHVHWLDQRAYHCALARLHPLVLTCWGSDINNLFDQANHDAQHRARITRSLARADRITADSKEVLERCEQLVGRNLYSSLFYFGIDLEKFKRGYIDEGQALRRNLGISPQTKVILSVRALRPLMGHHYILEAFARLASDRDLPDTALVFKKYLPFADGYEHELKVRIKELNLEERVHWLDEVSNDRMPIHYAMADVVVNYPERDGFPVSLFEAAACERPIVTSDLKAYEGVFAGALKRVPAKDATALSAALKTLFLEDSAQTRQRIETAHAVARELGSQNQSLATLERVYADAVSPNKGSKQLRVRPRSIFDRAQRT